MESQSHSRLLDLPPELHLAIVSELASIEDVEQLSLTCHYLRSVLLYLGGPALHKVAARALYAFGDCLRVTRAKQLPVSTLQQLFEFDVVKDEYRNPPEAAFFEGLAAPRLSLGEASKMLRLQSIAAIWERNYTDFSDLYIRDKWVEPVREGFYRAAYRYMLFGVVFSHAYSYPVQLVERAYPTQPESTERRQKEIQSYPPFCKKDKRRCRNQMDVLYAGFGEWLAADGARRTPYGEFEGSTKRMTGSERRSLTEIMLLFSVADEDCARAGGLPSGYTPPKIQSITDGKSYDSTIKLYTSCGFCEETYIVSGGLRVSRNKIAPTVGPDYSVPGFVNDLEAGFFQAVLTQTLRLRIGAAHFDYGSETRAYWRERGSAFLEAGHEALADYDELIEEVS